MGSFKNTISSLAFSPGMFDQLSFYSNRLRQEESVRRLGLILIIITMLVQLFAAMVPAEKSLAASEQNDVINGGVDTLAELEDKCDDRKDTEGLYNRFGLECNKIKGTYSVSNTTFDFSDQSKNGTKTVGRENLFADDKPLGPYNGTSTIFQARNPAHWPGSTSAYYFGKRKGTDNQFYYVWVIKDCGNIAFRHADGVDIFTPGTPITQPAPAPTLPPIVTTPPPAPMEAQQISCTSLRADRTSGTKSIKVTFTAQHSASPPDIFNGYTFNFGDGETSRQNGPSVEHTYNNTTEQLAIYRAYLVVHSPLGDRSGPTCQVDINVEPEVCTDSNGGSCAELIRTKKVQNITQGLSSSKTLLTKARASDVLEYSLTTKNSYTAPLNNFTVEDFIGDLLNYADLDQEFLKQQGGSFTSETKKISWANQTIPAKGELKKDFRMILKNPLPSTNQPNTTSTEYDCKMQNKYGEVVIVNVDCSVVKKVEQLPNTGPGTAIAAVFSLSTISGYFVARARLLTKELGIIKRSWRG